jgi:NAD(P)-dependent dehydrogenase (short-subunit alcohol dehydrogenase family)
MTKTALVTGASRGIGEAIAIELEVRGISVLRPKREDLDLCDIESVQKFVAEHSSDSVDILVNNAGENVVQPLAEVDFQTWSTIQNINLNAPFLLMQHFGVGMCQKRNGRILNIASLFSFLSKAGRASYTSSKSGLLGLTRTAAIEWAPYNVMVNCLSPGFVNTELTRKNNTDEKIKEISSLIPAGRMAEPSEIAKTAAFLVSQENSYLTGQNIVVDGGISIL